MSVRKRQWLTAKGEPREAWIVSYADADGDRHIETFARKKDADAGHAVVKVGVQSEIHVAASRASASQRRRKAGSRHPRQMNLRSRRLTNTANMRGITSIHLSER